MNGFMKGRNGADELTIVMGLAGIVIAMIGSIAASSGSAGSPSPSS